MFTVDLKIDARCFIGTSAIIILISPHRSPTSLQCLQAVSMRAHKLNPFFFSFRLLSYTNFNWSQISRTLCFGAHTALFCSFSLFMSLTASALLSSLSSLPTADSSISIAPILAFFITADFSRNVYWLSTTGSHLSQLPPHPFLSINYKQWRSQLPRLMCSKRTVVLCVWTAHQRMSIFASVASNSPKWSYLVWVELFKCHWTLAKDMEKESKRERTRALSNKLSRAEKVYIQTA